MKKKSLLDFTADLRNELQYFEQAMKDFSPRSDTEWYKLLGDYLGLSSGKIIFVNDLNENDFYRDDDTA